MSKRRWPKDAPHQRANQGGASGGQVRLAKEGSDSEPMRQRRGQGRAARSLRKLPVNRHELSCRTSMPAASRHSRALPAALQPVRSHSARHLTGSPRRGPPAWVGDSWTAVQMSWRESPPCPPCKLSACQLHADLGLPWAVGGQHSPPERTAPRSARGLDGYRHAAASEDSTVCHGKGEGP